MSVALKEWQVLVIEDEPHGMELMRDILAYHGIQAQGVSSGEEALEMLKEMSPTLILVDLALPQM
ncbi:MAG TPA: response regulator, partial [Aggregatilineales bacterium]|nr:response regulator [Aggregatilineales bacterium]